jgi:hypothetical protein
VTAQVADSVAIDGEPWLLLDTPLDGLLARIDAPDFVAPHTANWRGYVAQWRVDRDVLSLAGIEATVAGPDGRPRPVSGRDALGGVGVPLVADWVTGTLRVARGDQVRQVHLGFGSRWEEEVLLEVERGRVVARTVLDTPGPMGSAGPYRLIEPLLSGVSGGAFGQVLLAEDLNGADLVAKLPRSRGGGLAATEIHVNDDDGNRRPVHVPAVAVMPDTVGDWVIEDVDGEELEAVLEREAEILERDVGRLLPRCFGIWDHDPQGTRVLVMERLVGRRPNRLADVEALLLALAEAVERDTFEAHGDVKLEHVFVQEDDGRVRLCDPAPRFGVPGRRGYTPMYNPRGHDGPAADVAACATLLRHLVDDAAVTWRWCAAVLDHDTPPPWAGSHRAALDALRAAVAAGEPPPPGWTVAPMPSRTGHRRY